MPAGRSATVARVVRLLPALLLAAVLFPAAAAPGLFAHLDAAEVRALAERVRLNETGGDDERLLWWNEGEAFPSLGIGHFIWYPAGVDGPFRESFPELLRFLRSRDAALPAWLGDDADCPWPQREAWLAARARGDERIAELLALLTGTVAEQADFLLERFERDVATLFDGLPEPAARRLRERLQRVAAAPGGAYALVDYVNFKGAGTAPRERYAGVGWGLLQVLAAMRDDPAAPATHAFADAAAAVLRQRVANAPAARDESRWLPGWLRRVHGYRAP